MQEAQPRCCWREEGWSPGQVWRQKATLTRSLAASTARPRRSREGHVAIPAGSQPQLLALCGCHPHDRALQIKGEKPHLASARWGTEERLALLTLLPPVGVPLAQEPWAEQGVFLLAQWAALSTLEQEPSSLCKDGCAVAQTQDNELCFV